MSFLHIFSFSRLKFLFILVISFVLPACAVDDGGSSSDKGVLGIDWTAPSEREDVTPISLTEIAEYRVYYGTETGVYQDQMTVDGSETSAKISSLPPGTYYVVVTTVDTDGRESINSSEVVVTI